MFHPSVKSFRDAAVHSPPPPPPAEVCDFTRGIDIIAAVESQQSNEVKSFWSPGKVTMPKEQNRMRLNRLCLALWTPDAVPEEVLADHVDRLPCRVMAAYREDCAAQKKNTLAL